MDIVDIPSGRWTVFQMEVGQEEGAPTGRLVSLIKEGDRTSEMRFERSGLGRDLTHDEIVEQAKHPNLRVLVAGGALWEFLYQPPGAERPSLSAPSLSGGADTGDPGGGPGRDSHRVIVRRDGAPVGTAALPSGQELGYVSDEELGALALLLSSSKAG